MIVLNKILRDILKKIMNLSKIFHTVYFFSFLKDKLTFYWLWNRKLNILCRSCRCQVAWVLWTGLYCSFWKVDFDHTSDHMCLCIGSFVWNRIALKAPVQLLTQEIWDESMLFFRYCLLPIQIIFVLHIYFIFKIKENNLLLWE